jgi:hypothetical protein
VQNARYLVLKIYTRVKYIIDAVFVDFSEVTTLKFSKFVIKTSREPGRFPE